MKTFRVLVILMMGAAGWESMQAVAADRTALLIANSEYGSVSLPRARENVIKLSAVLERAGFKVTMIENVEKDFRKTIEAYVSTCPNGGISLFYYAGLGNRFDRKASRTVTGPDGKKTKEYFTEPDAGIWAVKGRQPYTLDSVTKYFRDKSHARLNLLFFDTTHSAKFGQPARPGLASIDLSALPGSMVCYAMPPEQALPGDTESSLAQSLAEHLTKADQPIGEVMQRVEQDVLKRSGKRQQIWCRFALEQDQQARLIPAHQRNISTAETPPANPNPGDEWMNVRGMIFCWCPPGTFRMGLDDETSPQTRDAKPVEVRISRGFWMSKFEVTYGDYVRIRGRGPLGRLAYPYGNAPLTTGYGGARDFGPNMLEKAERKENRMPEGWTYRLPTEAEWEYACRAGGKSLYTFGDTADRLHQFANYADAALYKQDDAFYYANRDHDDGVGRQPAPIGSYEPNAWGIHDMHGNVAEHVAGSYTPELPGGTDPWPRVEKSRSVHRGGAWCSTVDYCRSGFRNVTGGKDSTDYLGFRVVLARKDLTAEKKKK